MNERPPASGPDVILEYVRLGHLVRVSAMDPKTLTEVVVQGPAAGKAALRNSALRKLAYMLQRTGHGRR